MGIITRFLLMNSLKRQTTFFFVILLIMWGVIHWRADHVVLSNGARLEWTRCWFDVPFLGKTIKCAYLFPSSSIRLPVVVIKQPFWNRQPSPLLYLEGGPGYPTGLDQKGIDFWLAWLDENSWGHDLVLFEQRGIGLSQPRLDCPEVRSVILDILGNNLKLEEELSLGIAAIKQCYQRLRETDLSNYTTTNSSRDVADLMEALGGTNWNLYGASYGTRLALSVIRDYPERVRSVILDSVYPPEINELLVLPFIYDNALATLFQGCQADEQCHTSFENLELSFQNVLMQLRQAPVEVMVSAPKSLKVVINDYRFVEMVWQALYRWDFIRILPAAIESAQRGVYKPFLPIVEDYVTWLLDANFSYPVHLSVECHDSFPETTKGEFMAQVARFPRVKAFVKKYWDYNPCKIWRVGYANPAFHQPVSSDIPTLFLAGNYDPVTPPIWAKNAAKNFSQGQVFVFPGIGHGVVNSDYCASKLVQGFLRNPEQKAFEECLSLLTDSKFVVDEWDH